MQKQKKKDTYEENKILLNVVQAGVVTAFVTLPITSCGKQPDEPPVEEHNITFDGSKEFECQNGGNVPTTFNTNGTIDLSDLIIHSFDLQEIKLLSKSKVMYYFIYKYWYSKLSKTKINPPITLPYNTYFRNCSLNCVNSKK